MYQPSGQGATTQTASSTHGGSINDDAEIRPIRSARAKRPVASRGRSDMPNSVDVEKAEPSYANGVLTITVPKQEAKKARRLAIKTG